MQIQAVRQDITTLRTDVIVNSANTLMRMGGRRSVSGTIDRITEGRLQRRLDQDPTLRRPLPLGTVWVTEADVLPCDLIFHFATHGRHAEMLQAAREIDSNDVLADKLQQVVLQTIRIGFQNLIRACEKHHVTSLALPLLGTGTLGLPQSLVIEVMLGSLVQQLESHCPESLKLVQIVTLNQDSFQLLQEGINALPGGGQILLASSEAPRQRKSSEPEGRLSLVMEERDALARKNAELRSELIQLRRENRELRGAQVTSGESLGPEDQWQRIDLPTPLAYAQNLRTAETDPTHCHLNLISAIGIVTKYFAALACAEYVAAGCFRESLNRELRAKLQQAPMTDGSWNWVGKRIARAFYEEGKTGSVIRELPTAWISGQGEWSTLAEALRELVNRRNEIHDPVTADSAHAERWLARTLPVWEQMCKVSSALTAYELLFVDRIRDFSDEGKVCYVVRRLRGGYFVPPTESMESPQHLRAGKLFLQAADSATLLLLNPFLAYEYSTVTHSREAYCLDHIQQARFQFRAFRYAHKHHMNHDSQLPF